MLASASATRNYFLWAGALGILLAGMRLAINVVLVLRGVGSSDVITATAIHFGFLVFACLFFYVGLHFNEYLKSDPRRVLILLYAFGGWIICAFVLSVHSGFKLLTAVVGGCVLFALWTVGRNIRHIEIQPDAIEPVGSVRGLTLPIPARSTQNFLWSLMFLLYAAVGIGVEYSHATGGTSGTFDPMRLGLSILILISVIVVQVMWYRQSKAPTVK